MAFQCWRRDYPVTVTLSKVTVRTGRNHQTSVLVWVGRMATSVGRVLLPFSFNYFTFLTLMAALIMNYRVQFRELCNTPYWMSGLVSRVSALGFTVAVAISKILRPFYEETTSLKRLLRYYWLRSYKRKDVFKGFS